MARAWGIVFLVIMVFTGVWFMRASTFGTYLDENQHWSWSYGMLKTGSTHYVWDSDLGKAVPTDFKVQRGIVFLYLCAWGYKLFGSVVGYRFVILLFTLASFFIMAAYDRWRGVLTPQRLLRWTVLFFGSSMVLDISYFTRGYAPLGTVMILAFILYWEGLMRFRQGRMAPALGLWILALIPVVISVLDQWQLQGIPAFGLAVITSLAAFYSPCRPLTDWVRQKSGLLLLASIAASPLIIPELSHITWIKLSTVAIFNGQYATFFDNALGWVRFVLAVNVGFLAWRYAFKAPGEMTFDRWMFINGLLTGILSILYNPHSHIGFPKFVYLPALMMITGFCGLMDDVFVRPSARKKMLFIYLVINLLVSWENIYEHGTPRLASNWLNTHLAGDDVLLTFSAGDSLQYFGGQDLLPRAYRIFSTTDRKQITDLIAYLQTHSQGRIFYFYADQYAFRNWLSRVLTGKDRYPGFDLYSYLQKDIPSEQVIPLRQYGLVEFDRAVLLKGLDQLLKNGFEVHHRYTLHEFFDHWRHLIGH